VKRRQGELPAVCAGSPLQDVLGPLPYAAQQSLIDAGFPSGAYYYTKGVALGASGRRPLSHRRSPASPPPAL